MEKKDTVSFHPLKQCYISFQFIYFRFPDGREILKTLDGSIDFKDPGVDVYCIHGSDIPTAAQFRFKYLNIRGVMCVVCT